MTDNDTRAAPLALRLQGVNKAFGAVTALSDISFELRKGEFLTLLGPSGSGKSTMLRLIAGFMVPDSGSLWLHGTDIVAVPPNRRNIGMVFQDYALFPHLTAAQNVAFPLEARRVAVDQRRRAVADILQVVGLAGMEDRLPRQLSGGQQQRVALARALIFNPDLVLLDEPMAALDKKLRGAMQLEILRITRAFGATVISVTHDQEEALVMSDRIALFAKGKLVQIGTPQELYRAPKTKFVADFIGDANVLPGSISHQEGRVRVTCGQISFDPLPGSGAVQFAHGADVSLVIRPENIDVHVADANVQARSGRLLATATHIVYLGVECRILATVGEIPVQVRSRNLALMESVRPGVPIEISWRPEHAVILPGN